MAFALRLKCTSLLPKQDTRLVLVASGGTYSDLLTRLTTSFGFPIGCIKWQDSDGDLVTLASDNDLEALLACESGTVQVYVAPVDVPVDASMVHAVRAGAIAAPVSAGRLGSAERSKLPVSSASDTSSIASSVLRSEQKAAVATVPPTLAMPPTSRPASGGDGIVQKIATPAARGSAFKWQRGKKLGSGAYGTVYLGLLDSGELVAVKQLDTEDVSSRELSALEHEISMLQGLHHENIVRYLGTERVGDTLSIFLEYAPGGSLRQLLDAFGHQLDEATIRTYTRQLLLGLEYLHRAGIAHRDIKGGNVLLGGEGVIKLADFGQAKRLSTKTNSASSSAGGTATGFGEIKGTPLFMAPEVIREQNMTTGWRKADIWSVGCTVIEMATGRPPWGDKFQNALQAMYTIACTEDLPPLPDTMSAMGKDFLSLCLRRDAASRPDVTLLLLHPFVAGLGPAIARGPRSGRKDVAVVQRPSTSHDSRQPSVLEAMSAPNSRWIATSSRSKRSGMAAPLRVASSASTMSNDAEDRASIASKDSAALASSVDLAAAPTGPAGSSPAEFESRVVLGMDDLPGLRDSPKHEAGSKGHSRTRGAPSHAMYTSPDFTPFAFTSVEESSMGSVEVSHLASGRDSTETGSVVTTGSAADVSPAPALGLSDSHGFESLPAAWDRPQGRQSARRAGQGALVDGHNGRNTVQVSSNSSSHGSTRVLGALRVSPPMRRSAVVPADRALTESSVTEGMERWNRAAAETDPASSIPTHAAIMAAAIIEGSASSQSHLQRPSSLYSRSQLPYSDGPLPSPMDGHAPFVLPAGIAQQDTVSTAGRHKYTYNHGTSVSASTSLSNTSGKLAGGPQSSHGAVSGIPRIRSAAKTPRSQGQGTPSGSHQSVWQQSQPASAAHRYVTREESGPTYPAPAAAQPPAAIAYTVISDVSGPAIASKQASSGATVSTASRIPSAGMRGGGVSSQPVGQGLQGGKSSGLSRTTPMGWAESKERSPEGKPATGIGARSSAMHTRWGGASSDNEMDSAASVGTAGSVEAQESALGALRIESGSPYRSMARMVSSEVLSTGGAGTYGQAAIHVDRDTVSGRQAGIPAPMPVHPWTAVAGYVQRQNDDSQAANSLSISPNRAAIQSSLTLLRTRSGGFRRPRGSATGATVAALPSASAEEHSPDLLPRGEPAGTIMDSSVLGSTAEPTGYAAQFAQRRALQSRSASHGGGAVSPVAKVHPGSAAQATGSGDSNKGELQQYSDAQAYSNAAVRTTQTTSRHYRQSAAAPVGPSSPDMDPPSHGSMYEGSAGQGYGSLFSPSHSPLSHVKHGNREHRGYG